MDISTAKASWIMLVKKYFKDSPSQLQKLSMVRFVRGGEMKPGVRATKYAEKHYPSLVAKFKKIRDNGGKND